MQLFAHRQRLGSEVRVEAQDILDAVCTLQPTRVLPCSISAPGKGPEFFLQWANEELKEATSSTDEMTRNRKYYNAAILAKGAVECLVDWYLSKFLLNLTISPMAGAAQKIGSARLGEPS
jgi:hypothetical protein